MAQQGEGESETLAVRSTGETGAGFRDQLAMMRKAFMASPLRNRIFTLGGGIFAVILVTAGGQVLLNRWYKPFYDALERRDLGGFFYQLLVFAGLAVALLLLNVGQTWLNQRLRLRLREGLTLDLIAEWMQPRRGFRLAHAGAIGVNPDQRMQEDAGHLADLSTDLGVGLLQSTILLASFVGVLWALSAGFVFHVGGRSFEIPGYMVWAAVIYAFSASWLSWLVGRPLIALNSERYSREAEFRYSLMRVNEQIDAISLAGGEADERRRLAGDLDGVLTALRRIFSAQINLAWITGGYGWFTVVAPILVAAPVYFAGDISFGGLMMAVGAFNQVHSSLRWFINNIGAIADWRATLMRVAAFRRALLETDLLHDSEQRIAFSEGAKDVIALDNLEIASPAGCTRLAETHVEIGRGERVLVTGDPGAGKTLLFRALAGLWPWGSGSISLPAGQTIAFLPRTPYFPPGTLREVMAYPEPAENFQDEALVTMLADAGLGRLTSSLDRSGRWDRELTEEEQRLLAFARLRLHRPDWIVVDEALDRLERPALERVMAGMEKDLRDSAVIYLGRGPRDSGFFSRSLHLIKDPQGRSLTPAPLQPALSAAAG